MYTKLNFIFSPFTFISVSHIMHISLWYFSSPNVCVCANSCSKLMQFVFISITQAWLLQIFFWVIFFYFSSSISSLILFRSPVFTVPTGILCLIAPYLLNLLLASHTPQYLWSVSYNSLFISACQRIIQGFPPTLCITFPKFRLSSPPPMWCLGLCPPPQWLFTGLSLSPPFAQFHHNPIHHIGPCSLLGHLKMSSQDSDFPPFIHFLNICWYYTLCYPILFR